MNRKAIGILTSPGAQLMAVLVLAAFLRFHRLTEESVWGDELLSVRLLASPTLGAFLRQLRLDDPPMFPGYFGIEYCVAKIIGTSPFILRSLSISFSLAGIATIYCLARRFFGGFAAVVTGLCLACSVQQINYAQEIRTYALTSLLAAASVYAMFVAIEKKGLRHQMVWFAINAALLSTHMMAVLLVVVEGLFLLTSSDGRKGVLFFVLIHLDFAIAWFRGIDFAAMAGATQWIAMPDLPFLFAALGLLADYYTAPLRLFPPAVNALKATGCFLIVLAALVFVLKTVADGRRSTVSSSAPNPSLFLIMWFILPPAMLVAASFLYRPCLISRYILHCSYPLFMMAGAGIAAIPYRAPKWIIAMGLTALLVILAPLHNPLRVNWVAATDEVRLRAKPTDALITPIEGECPLLRFYLPALAQNIQFCERKDLAKELSRRAMQGGGAFVFLTHLLAYSTEQELANNDVPYDKKEFDGPPLLLLYVANTHK